MEFHRFWWILKNSVSFQEIPWLFVKVVRLPRKKTMHTSKVLRLPRKLPGIFWKRRKSIAPATQNDFRHVTKHLWMSRSATPATRNEATRRLKPPKMTTSAELTIGTAMWQSRGRLRTVADGCGRLRPWTQRRANAPSTPRPPEWNGNACYAFRKKWNSTCWFCSPPPSPSIGVGNLPERNRRTGEVWFCRGSHTIWSAGS